MREAFAVHTGIVEILAFEILNETLTNNAISFEQLGPVFQMFGHVIVHSQTTSMTSCLLPWMT